MAGKLAKTLGWGGFVVGCAIAKMVLQQSRHWDLSEKVVLITGGSRGLGLVMAREFAARGARVGICARDADDLARVQQEFEARGDHFFSTQCDVSDGDQVRGMIDSVENALGPVDVLVNNAGTIIVGPFEHMTMEDFQDVMRINFWGAVHTTLAVLPGMKQRHRGRIVNITSIGGKVAFPHLLPYTASKFALVGFSEGLRAELVKDGIYVTTVVPNLMRTGSPRNVDVKGDYAKEYAWFTISDSLPVASMSAERAARQIVRACQNGDSEVVLGLPAKMAVVANGIAPGLLSDLLAAGNEWLLPSATATSGTERRKGYESESPVSRSALTSLTRAAERANNEV
ncbi:MAG TPA: SDR family oxidoreductase [Terriglobales bacterium]|nr:SDR family oxidoreductase [Terriglobales bacterium]